MLGREAAVVGTEIDKTEDFSESLESVSLVYVAERLRCNYDLFS